jgi:AcrR family transcriptional regulator
MSQQRAALAGAVQPADARQRITHAAFRLFGQRSYSSTSIQDIADAAEVQKSIVYYYFASKEGLYRALYDESIRNLRAVLLEALAAAGLPESPPDGCCRLVVPAGLSCETLLSALAERLIGLTRDNLEPARFFMAHIFTPDGDRPPISSEEVEHITPLLIQQLAETGVQRGELVGSPEDLTRLVLGAIQYSIIRHLRHPEKEPLLPGLGARIVKTVLRSFAPPAPAAPARRKRPAGRHEDARRRT